MPRILAPHRKGGTEALRLAFIGTRGNTRQRSRRHRRHSALLIHYAGADVMIDCGADWARWLRSLSPSAIVLTHAHPDHSAGLAKGAPCPVFATSDTFASLAAFPLQEKRTVPIGKPFTVGGLSLEAFPVEHSIRAPAVGYRVSAGQSAFFYVPDVVAIPRQRDALRGICLYIGDGATISRPIMRRRQAGVIGHTPIATQLGWCEQEGARYAIFTHCRSEIVTGNARRSNDRVRRLGRHRGVYAAIAHDGLELFVDTGAASIGTRAHAYGPMINSAYASLGTTTETVPLPMQIEPRAEHFSHAADIGIRGIGPTREAAFEQAALALSGIVTDVAAVEARQVQNIECEAPNDALLLVDWLNALIYRMAVDHMLFARFAVTIEGERLRGQAWGEAVDRIRHAPAVEPKGATYTALKVERRSDGAWIAQCVVDV